jgi:hypothetical protein
VEITDESLRLVDDAVFYTALIQRVLQFERDQQLRASRTLVGYRAKGKFHIS